MSSNNLSLINDPIIYQLLENCCSNITPLSAENLQLLINFQTGKLLTFEEITKLFENFKVCRKSKKIKKTIFVKKFNIEINVSQIRMFFFHLRCFGEYLNFIKDSIDFDSTIIFFGLNGIITVTQKFVDFLKVIKKDAGKIDNLVEKWIDKGLAFDYEQQTDIPKEECFSLTKFTVTSIKNMLIIFQKLEDDVNDVMNKLERKLKSSLLVSWELDGILIIICQLAKQAYDFAFSGLLDDDQMDDKSILLSLFLSSQYFETVINNADII